MGAQHLIHKSLQVLIGRVSSQERCYFYSLLSLFKGFGCDFKCKQLLSVEFCDTPIGIEVSLRRDRGGWTEEQTDAEVEIFA